MKVSGLHAASIFRSEVLESLNTRQSHSTIHGQLVSQSVSQSVNQSISQSVNPWLRTTVRRADYHILNCCRPITVSFVVGRPPLREDGSVTSGLVLVSCKCLDDKAFIEYIQL
jgi:hypothetical protein